MDSKIRMTQAEAAEELRSLEALEAEWLVKSKHARSPQARGRARAQARRISEAIEEVQDRKNLLWS